MGKKNISLLTLREAATPGKVLFFSYVSCELDVIEASLDNNDSHSCSTDCCCTTQGGRPVSDIAP